MTNLNKPKPVGISSDGLVRIYEIVYETDDYVKYRFLYNPMETSKIVYQTDDESEGSGFYTKSGLWYSFNEIMRYDISPETTKNYLDIKKRLNW